MKSLTLILIVLAFEAQAQSPKTPVRYGVEALAPGVVDEVRKGVESRPPKSIASQMDALTEQLLAPAEPSQPSAEVIYVSPREVEDRDELQDARAGVKALLSASEAVPTPRRNLSPSREITVLPSNPPGGSRLLSSLQNRANEQALKPMRRAISPRAAVATSPQAFIGRLPYKEAPVQALSKTTYLGDVEPKRHKPKPQGHFSREAHGEDGDGAANRPTHGVRSVSPGYIDVPTEEETRKLRFRVIQVTGDDE